MSDFQEHMDEVRLLQEQQAALAKQHDEIAKAEIESFLDSLSPEQLNTLNRMITISVNDTDAGWQFTGAIAGCLMWKHSRTWDGGESPLNAPETMMAHKIRLASGEPMTDMEKLEKEADDIRAAQMREYNLVPDPENHAFKCGNCGMFYITLEDRMIMEPGVRGCSGCQQKAMFG